MFAGNQLPVIGVCRLLIVLVGFTQHNLVIAQPEQIEDKKWDNFQCVAVRVWHKIVSNMKKILIFLLQSHFVQEAIVCRVARLCPASKCRSFGKTESWAWRIITVHFSNWAGGKTISKFVTSSSCLPTSKLPELSNVPSFLFSKCLPVFNELELKLRLEMIA